MVYSPHQWQDNNVGAPYGPISAARLGDMETGISDALLRAGDTMTGALTITLDAANTLGIRSFVSSASGPVLALRKGRGTSAAPLRVKLGDALGQVGSSGYWAADDVTTGTLAANRAHMLFVAEADWVTATDNGERIDFYTTPTSSGTAVRRMALGSSNIPVRVLDPGVTHTPGLRHGLHVVSTTLGTISVSNRIVGIYSQFSDPAAAVNKTVSGAANNGSGLIRITTSTAHTFATGDYIGVVGVVGTTEANGAWVVTVIDTTNFDLQASTFTNAYVSGGTATNRGMGYCYAGTVVPTLNRGGLTGTAANADDVNCFVGYNGGTGSGTDAFYLGRNSTNFAAVAEFGTGFTVDAYLTYWAFGVGTPCQIATGGAVFDASRATLNGTAVRLSLGDGDVKLGTTTGVKFGTATSQKLAFFNSTPIVQPTATTDLRTALINLGLVATGGASPLDLNGGAFTAVSAALGTAPTAAAGAIRLANDSAIFARNAANSADVEIARINASNEVSIPGAVRFSGTGGVTIANTNNLIFSTSTGTKIGTGATQKIGFWNAAPVAQPSATGETVGFTAGGGTGVTDASTFTGNVGATAYRLSDIVKHLKNMGLIAA